MLSKLFHSKTPPDIDMSTKFNPTVPIETPKRNDISFFIKHLQDTEIFIKKCTIKIENPELDNEEKDRRIREIKACYDRIEKMNEENFNVMLLEKYIKIYQFTENDLKKVEQYKFYPYRPQCPIYHYVIDNKLYVFKDEKKANQHSLKIVKDFPRYDNVCDIIYVVYSQIDKIIGFYTNQLIAKYEAIQWSVKRNQLYRIIEYIVHL